MPNHQAVRHSVGEFVREQAHTNGMESFWAGLKRGYEGVYHHMSAKHLGRYVGEFEGRHNSRPLDTAEQMAAMARGAEGKRLTYDALIGPKHTRLAGGHHRGGGSLSNWYQKGDGTARSGAGGRSGQLRPIRGQRGPWKHPEPAAQGPRGPNQGATVCGGILSPRRSKGLEGHLWASHGRGRPASAGGSRRGIGRDRRSEAILGPSRSSPSAGASCGIVRGDPV